MHSNDQPWRKSWPDFVPPEIEVDRPITDYLREVCQSYPEGIALDFQGFKMTFGELGRNIDRFARSLLALGLNKGDRIALHMQNCPQFVISYFASLRAGLIVVCVNPMLKRAEIEHELNDSGATAYVGMDELYPEVEVVREKTSLSKTILTTLGHYAPSGSESDSHRESGSVASVFPGVLDFADLVARPGPELAEPTLSITEDLALLQYTGGTTGLPKGAMISHHALSTAAVGSKVWFQNHKEDVCLGVTPYFHIMGMVQTMCAPLLAGGRLVVIPRFEAGLAVRAISENGVTMIVCATTVLVALLQIPNVDEFDFSSLRYITTGGAPVGIELQDQIAELAPKAMITEGYGLTECVSHGGAITPLGGYRPGFVGVPHVNAMKIVDLATGEKELPPGEEGEIVVNGPVLFSGYWRNPAESAQTLRDGWLHTGDVGMMDEQGYLKLLGRSKDLIKCSGFSVFPAEVEGLLYRHPAVGEVAVVGVPDSYRGESPKAFVVLKPAFEGQITEQEILDWSKENMAAYKRPRAVEFRSSLPKSGTGKILHRLLRESE
jgi:long-chain acyl-CoA synthetase